MFAAQNGGCAICASPPARQYLAVDHDHLSPDAPPVFVRGLLDFRCNSAISLLRDRPLFVLNAALYLLRALATFAESTENPKAHPRMLRPAEFASARRRLQQIDTALSRLERVAA